MTLYRLRDFQFSLGMLVRVRQILAGLALLTLVAGFLFPLLSRPSLTDRAQHPLAPPVAAVGIRPLNDYLAVLKQKNLFQGGKAVIPAAYGLTPRATHRAANPAAVMPEAPPKPTLAALAADYQVVGLLNSNTQAVVSNKKTQETSYVSAGDHLGDMTVKSVGAGGLTVSYESQTLDLPF